MRKQFYVYILASKRYGTLYIGVTAQLAKRIWIHKASLSGGFTHKYKVQRLVYYQAFATAKEAIHREKRLKEWKRQWKINLIEQQNPYWEDLYGSII